MKRPYMPQTHFGRPEAIMKLQWAINQARTTHALSEAAFDNDGK